MARFVVVLLLVALAVVALEAKPSKSPVRKLPPSGVKPLSTAEIQKHPKFRKGPAGKRGVTAIPSTFDARKQWPNCVSIKTIRDQGQCGTCWAVSAASVLSDRICIASGQKTNVFISPTAAAGCPYENQNGTQNCKSGGDPSAVYKFASLYGLPTGGEYGSNIGCAPYSVAHDDDSDVFCPNQCSNGKYTPALAKDKYFIDNYYIDYAPYAVPMSQDKIDAAVKHMQTDIMTSGPITAIFSVYSDFFAWNSSTGAYKGPGPGATNQNGHAVRIIGWNKDKNGVPYWMIANSWTTDMGDKGIYWMQLGKNTCGIENGFSAPIISEPNTCVGASFCESFPDSIATTNNKDAKAPLYMFKGNCTQKVQITGDKFVAIGKAIPIQKEFMGAPAGPITSVTYTPTEGEMWFHTWGQNAGEGGMCEQLKKATRHTCRTFQEPADPNFNSVMVENEFYDASGRSVLWRYSNDHKSLMISPTGGAIEVRDLVSSKLSRVTKMMDMDGTKMWIYGRDLKGAPVAGVMKYGESAATLTWAVKPGPVKNTITCTA